jgi:hypothetical protein
LRRLSAFLLFLLGAAVAAVAVRRLTAGRRTSVDLYYEDGSLTSFGEESAEGASLIALAGEVRRASAA